MLDTTPTNRTNYWQQQIAIWQESGLSCTRFCQHHQLVYHQFIYWRRKLVAGDDVQPAAASAGFAQVCHQHQTEYTTSHLSLALSNGMVLQDINRDNLTLVRQLLEVLS